MVALSCFISPLIPFEEIKKTREKGGKKEQKSQPDFYKCPAQDAEITKGDCLLFQMNSTTQRDRAQPKGNVSPNIVLLAPIDHVRAAHLLSAPSVESLIKNPMTKAYSSTLSLASN